MTLLFCCCSWFFTSRSMSRRVCLVLVAPPVPLELVEALEMLAAVVSLVPLVPGWVLFI